MPFSLNLVLLIQSLNHDDIVPYIFSILTFGIVSPSKPIINKRALLISHIEAHWILSFLLAFCHYNITFKCNFSVLTINIFVEFQRQLRSPKFSSLKLPAVLPSSFSSVPHVYTMPCSMWQSTLFSSMKLKREVPVVVKRTEQMWLLALKIRPQSWPDWRLTGSTVCQHSLSTVLELDLSAIARMLRQWKMVKMLSF